MIRHVIGALMTLMTLSAAVPASVSPAAARMFDPTTFTLDNGMQVVVIENHRAPVVAHYVWYKVGTADSPPGKSGLAHFLEHLMFKGTDTLAPGEFSRIVARNGGNDNAFTSQDFTAYHQTIAKDRLELVMQMEADRMVNLQLTDEAVYPERDVVLEERSMRVDNEPGALLGEQIDAAQFLNHPYGKPVIGWQHEIASYTREDAIAFYKQHYAPNNAILIVAGDITAEELRPLAERTYGQIPARPIEVRERIKEPPQIAARRVEFRDPRVRQPSLSRSYLASRPAEEDAPNREYALTVLAEIFGGGTTSRLYRSLVVEQGLAANAGASFRDSTLDTPTFRLYAIPRDPSKMAELEAALDAEITKILKEGPDELEVERAKKRMIAESVYARDSLGGAARIFGVALTTGFAIEDVETWPERIGAVTTGEVAAAAEAVFDITQSVTGLLLGPETPTDGAPEG